MKYMLCNDRYIREGYCALCTEPVWESYVREIGTRLLYCSVEHYRKHCNVAVLAIEGHARRVN